MFKTELLYGLWEMACTIPIVAELIIVVYCCRPVLPTLHDWLAFVLQCLFMTVTKHVVKIETQYSQIMAHNVQKATVVSKTR